LNIEEQLKNAALEILTEGLALHELIFHPGKKGAKISVVLDKPGNQWGTPDIQDCENFSRKYSEYLERFVAEKLLADDYTLEVSSPGAERVLPDQTSWERFKSLPMKVNYIDQNDREQWGVLNYKGEKEGGYIWSRYTTKKERKLKKGAAGKKNTGDFALKTEQIKSVRLYVDF